MSQKANHFKIGLFVIASATLLVVAIVILGTGILFKREVVFETYMDGAVNGLEVGSPVKLRGVEIGKVKEIAFVDAYYKTDLRYVLVRVSVESDMPVVIALAEIRHRLETEIAAGLRVRLAPQGVTGGSYLDCDYVDPEKFPAIPITWTPLMLYCPSAPSVLAGIGDSLINLLDKVDKAQLDELAQDVDKLVNTIKSMAEQDVTPALQEVRRTSSQITTTLLSLNQTIDETLEQDVRPVLRNAEVATKGLPLTMDRLNRTMDRVDGILRGQEAKIDATLTSIQAITANLEKVDDLPESVDHFNRTLGQFDALIASEQDGINEIVQNLQEASRNLNELTEWAKKNPSGVLFGEPPPQDGGDH